MAVSTEFTLRQPFNDVICGKMYVSVHVNYVRHLVMYHVWCIFANHDYLPYILALVNPLREVQNLATSY